MLKRVISDIISIVLIVILVIFAVSIVGMAVFRIVGQSGELAESEVNTDLLAITGPVEITGQHIRFSITRNFGSGDIVGANVISEQSGSSASVTQAISFSQPVKLYETREISFFISGQPVKVSVVPIVRTQSGKELTGRITDSTTDIVYS